MRLASARKRGRRRANGLGLAAPRLDAALGLLFVERRQRRGGPMRRPQRRRRPISRGGEDSRCGGRCVVLGNHGAETGGKAPFMADGVGFEPTNPCGLAVFKTAALNRSATHPRTPTLSNPPDRRHDPTRPRAPGSRRRAATNPASRQSSIPPAPVGPTTEGNQGRSRPTLPGARASPAIAASRPAIRTGNQIRHASRKFFHTLLRGNDGEDAVPTLAKS